MCHFRFFHEIITDSPNATEIEMTKDGQWRITNGGEVDGNVPCQSHKPDKPIEGSTLFFAKTL